MKIGLCFNLKKEMESDAGDKAEPGGSKSSCKGIHHAVIPRDFYAECDSMETINAVHDALAVNNDVVLIEADENCYGKFRAERPDIVFNIAEGIYGAAREAHIPCMLEYLRIPYTGSDPLTLAICLDKQRTKEVLHYYNIPMPKSEIINSHKALKSLRRNNKGFFNARNEHLKYPLMVKPVGEGSSKGIVNDAVVRNEKELGVQISRILELYTQPALAEEYLPGREFTVAMLGNGKDARALPIVEIIFDTLPEGVNHIYSYEAKWIWDVPEKPLDIFKCPAAIPAKLRKRIESICVSTYNALNCKDWSRIDVRCDSEGNPNILEINPLPGILPNPEDNSCFPKAARTAGMSYGQLINNVLDTACARYGLKNSGRRARNTATACKVL